MPNHSVSSTSSADSTGPTQSYWVCSLIHWIIPSLSLPPLYSIGFDLSLPQNLRVGNPWISTPATSFSVESSLARTMLGLLASNLAASSQWGAKCLQCPHQGAWNLTKTYFSVSKTNSLKVFPTITLTGSSFDSGMGADFKKGSISPFLIWLTKWAKFSAVISVGSNLNFSCLLLRKRILGVEERSTPKYSASLSQSPWPSFFDETDTTNSGLVASQALNASSAADSASSSPWKRKRASLESLKTFSMASLLKGITAERASVAKSATNRYNFIQITKNYRYSWVKIELITTLVNYILGFNYNQYILSNRRSTDKQLYVNNLHFNNMDPLRSISRSSNQKKTTYFEKYRRELERISDQIKKDSLYSSTSVIASPIIKEKTQPLTVKQIVQQQKPSPIVEKEAVQPKKIISKPNVLIKKEEELPISSKVEPKQDLQYMSKQAQVLKQVQVLIQQSQTIKKKIQKLEVQIEGKKKIMNEIKMSLAGVVSEQEYLDNIVKYASKILNIQQKMKDKKEGHEEELGKLVAQKNQIHAENVEISKQIELCLEEAEQTDNELFAMQLESPSKNLETKANNLRYQISKLQDDYEQLIEGVNQNEEIKELGYREYKKYAQIYIKKLIGREVALAEDRIKSRGQSERQKVEIQKKKMKLNEKKVELMIRKRCINDASRLISNLHIKIKLLQSELKIVNPPDRKMSIFDKLGALT